MKNRRRGLTLIEMVTVMAITGVIAATLALPLAGVAELWDQRRFEKEVVDQAQFGLDRMAWEIRHLWSDQRVFTADATTLEFDTRWSYGDYGFNGWWWDGDGTVERVNYQYAPGVQRLLRNGSPVAERVSGCTFTYYGMYGNILSGPKVSPQDTDLWRVEIQVTISSGARSTTLTESVYPRSLLRQVK